MRQYERCPRCGATDLYTQEASGCWGARVICSNCRLQIPKASNMMMLGGAIHEEEQSMDRTGRYPWEDHVFRHTVQVLQGTWDGRGLVRDAKGDLQSIRDFASQVEGQAYGYPSDKPIKIHVAAHVCDMPACSAEKAAKRLLEQLWDAVRQTEDAVQRSVYGARGDVHLLEFELLRIRRCLKELMPLLLSAFALTGAVPWPYEQEVRQATFVADSTLIHTMRGFRGALMDQHIPPDLRPIWEMPMPNSKPSNWYEAVEANVMAKAEEQIITENSIQPCRAVEPDTQKHQDREQVKNLGEVPDKAIRLREELEQEIGRKAIDAMVNIKRALDGVIAYIKVLYPDIDLDQETVKRWAEYRVASGPLWADLETLEPRYSPEAMAQITTVALMIQHGYSEPIIAQARQIVLAGMLVEDDYVRGTMAILADGDRVEEPAEECSRLAQAVQAYAEALNGARATIWLREPQAWTGKIKTWTNSQGTPVMQYAIELEE